MNDKKILLSTLWIFATLNYLYCDVVGLMDSGLLSQYLTGTVNGMEMNENFLLSGAILMEIPIAMVILSRLLKHTANRWANIIAGSIKTVIMILTMFVATPKSYYLFFGSIEIVTTMVIVWYAWNWTKPEEVTVSI
ncbi:MULTISPECIES: DUF6326 family protein [unclassified Imperialibacter]|uniref:DUF6326 family protein n=1 Tax=unclassified Imperialibacter TaxID=2629706 RepID=UPI0012525088|nr:MULTISPECIES: DUF6326 family protein [unclassified Imperialibacter]CAD5254246.1 conserved membrane hypothetical protein [Imperialibacter sp. 75]CAD5262688.1 conserved membrane hypothetical protein [Imperialibacter sp. 89]VVT35295.1 conserved membrane hypothetical protein [Imperialibacter sp. EC-SDR9]